MKNKVSILLLVTIVSLVILGFGYVTIGSSISRLTVGQTLLFIVSGIFALCFSISAFFASFDGNGIAIQANELPVGTLFIVVAVHEEPAVHRKPQGSCAILIPATGEEGNKVPFLVHFPEKVVRVGQNVMAVTAKWQENFCRSGASTTTFLVTV